MIACTRTVSCQGLAGSFLRALAFLLLLWPGAVLAQETALPPAAALALIDGNTNSAAFVIVDLRSRREFDEGHIQGARQIDYYATNFLRLISQLDRNATILLYCQRGRQSPLALKTFEKQRFTDVFMLDGGFHAWVEAGLPVAR